MTDAGDKDPGGRAKVTFPIHCRYRGGNTALGRHGMHLWITDGRIGHGELKLTHGVPLAEVQSVEVTERSVGGADVSIIAMPGLPLTRQVPGAAPRQVTEVTVRTVDGQQALWLIRDRGAAGRRSASVPPSVRPGSPSTRTFDLTSGPPIRDGGRAGWGLRSGSPRGMNPRIHSAASPLRISGSPHGPSDRASIGTARSGLRWPARAAKDPMRAITAPPSRRTERAWGRERVDRPPAHRSGRWRSRPDARL